MKKYYDIVTKILESDMRSLPLITVFFLMGLFNPVKVVASTMLPADYYAISLPFEETAGATLGKTTLQQQVDEKSQQAMTLLLRRITGNERLLNSTLGANYIKQAKSWLSNYNLTPRYEDGVAVGKNLVFNFDAQKLNADFKNRNVKIWPNSQRSTTLVMGSFVQRGSLQKLTDELLNYRIDIDFRDYPQRLRLPIKLPQTTKNWIFPVEPEQTKLIIQELLIANNLKQLLSFKLVAQTAGQYQLDWYLFSLTGAVLAKNSISGPNRQELMQSMFNQVMDFFVKQSSIKLVKKNHLIVAVSGIPNGDSVALLERELQAQQPMIRQAQLTSIDNTAAEFDIEYQGDIEVLLNWLRNWPRVEGLNNVSQQRLQGRFVDIPVAVETTLPVGEQL